MTEQRPALAAETLAELRHDAQHERDRLALYRAKIMGSRPTSLARLREIERSSERADQRLAHALRDTPRSA